MTRSRYIWLLVPALCGVIGYWAGLEGGRKFWQRWIFGAPILDCPYEFDVGERENGSRVTIPFVITNAGRSLLEISEIQTSCSCAGLEINDGGSFARLTTIKLRNAESLSVRLKINVGGRPGQPTEVKILLKSNDPIEPIHPLICRISRVNGGLSWRPESIGFGSVPISTKRIISIDVFDAGRPDQSIERVEIDHSNHITATFIRQEAGPLTPEGWHKIGRIDVECNGTSPGPLDGGVLIYTADTSRPPDRIPVYGEIVPHVLILPKHVVLPIRTQSGWKEEVRCHVRRADGEKFVVEITQHPAAFSVSVNQPQEMSSLQYVYISKVPGREPAANTEITIRVQTRDETHDVTIPVRWLSERMP